MEAKLVSSGDIISYSGKKSLVEYVMINRTEVKIKLHNRIGLIFVKPDTDILVIGAIKNQVFDSLD